MVFGSVGSGICSEASDDRSIAGVGPTSTAALSCCEIEATIRGVSVSWTLLLDAVGWGLPDAVGWGLLDAVGWGLLDAVGWGLLDAVGRGLMDAVGRRRFRGGFLLLIPNLVFNRPQRPASRLSGNDWKPNCSLRVSAGVT
jgi:hypothetical protein